MQQSERFDLQKGFLISFEGLEGCGKSTQIELLRKALESRGYDVLVSREPGGTALAEKLRHILLESKEHMSSKTELLLLLAGRCDHLENVILPSLQSGRIVILDRFIDASLAYQGFGRDMGLAFIQQMHELLGLWAYLPQRTFLLEMPLDLSQKRVLERGQECDRIEKENRTFFQKVQKGYAECVKNDPERYYVIDGNHSVQNIHHDILERLLKDFYEYSLS